MTKPAPHYSLTNCYVNAPKGFRPDNDCLRITDCAIIDLDTFCELLGDEKAEELLGHLYKACK